MLLQRNSLVGVPAPQESGLAQVAGPLSITIPTWCKGPWDLVSYYEGQLQRHFGRDGEEWKSPINFRANLKPAKYLIDTYGVEHSIRAIHKWLALANNPPTLWWVWKKEQE